MTELTASQAGLGGRPMSDSTLQNLADIQAIRDLQNHYSRSIDAGEYDNLDSVFLPDVVADYRHAGQHTGVEGIKDTCREALDPLTSSQHTNGNHWAEINGDTANAGCYFTVELHLDDTPGGDHFRMGGIYTDELVRTAAGWRIARRSLVVNWSDGNPDVRFVR